MKRKLMGQKKKQLFTKRFFPAGNYTWVVPPGCTEVDVFLVGAGGGTGGFTTSWGCWGAGGGGYTKTFKAATTGWRDGEAIPVTSGQSIPIIVGSGIVNGDGGYSQFLDSAHRAEGGKKATSYRNGGNGGSAGGCWWDVNKINQGDGATDGGSTLLSNGQGHTTRDFGEATGKRNAGGGSTGYAGPNSSGSYPNKGVSDYTEGSGQYPPYWVTSPTWVQVQFAGGGYGGGASAGYPAGNNLSAAQLKGGDGTVLIRYYAYRE